MISEALIVATQIGMLTFVVTGMAAVGLGLTVPQITTPLRDLRLVGMLLLANFVAVPLVAIVAARVLPMEEASATAIILIGCVAGAPFLPKLAMLARGDPGLAIGAMVMLMVVTVFYAPVVIPLAVEGAAVQAWDIASSLIFLMLVPLALGLLIRARYEELADSWVGTAQQISSVALLIGIGAALFVSWRDVLEAIGSWVFVGAAIVLATGLVAGYVAGFGLRDSDAWVTSLATAQRNIAAAIVVAASLGGDTVVLTLVAALVIPIVLIVLAAELGRRVTAT